MNKQEAIDALRRDAATLAESVCPGTRAVPGEGDLNAKLMLIGEAPGAEEERLGRPFVGPAGRFLGEELARARIDRSSIYITATVRCRPTSPGARGPRNRAPNREEIQAWSSHLLREIEIISPTVILCLGLVAARAVVGPEFQMSSDRGLWFDRSPGTRVLATYHPAYVRRFGVFSNTLESFRRDLEKALRESQKTCTPATNR